MKKRIIALTLALVMVLSFSSCNLFTKKGTIKEVEGKSFNQLMDEILVYYMTNNSFNINFTFEDPSKYGLQNIRPKLPLVSKDEFDKSNKAVEKYITEVNKFNVSNLSEKNKFDYKVVKNFLETSMEYQDFYYYSNSYLDSRNSFAANLPLLLIEYRFDDKQDVDDYIGFLNQIPDAFNSYIKYENDKLEAGTLPSKYVLETCAKTLETIAQKKEDNAVIVYFDEDIKALSFLTDAQKQEYKAINKKLVLDNLIPAYKNASAQLTTLSTKTKNTKGIYETEKGKKYYELLFRDSSGSLNSVDVVYTMLKKELDSSYTRLREMTAEDKGIYNNYINAKVLQSKNEETIKLLGKNIEADFPANDNSNLTVKTYNNAMPK